MFGSSTRSSSSGLMPAAEGFAAFASMPNPFNPCGNIFSQAQNTFGSSLFGSSAMIGGGMVTTTGASRNSAFGKSTNHASDTSGGIGFGYSSYAGFGQPTSAPSSRSSLFAAPASFSEDHSFSLGSLQPRSAPSSLVAAPSFFLGNQSFPIDAQTRTLAHGSNSFAPQMFPNGCRGSRVAAYNPEAERDSQTCPPGIVVSIVSMPAYNNRSHEELRWEEYQLGDKGTTSFGLPTFLSQTQKEGTRIAAYESTIDPEGLPIYRWKLVSLSSMTPYKEKSHEELRWEDYQLGDKGCWTQNRTNGCGMFGAPPYPFQNNGTGMFGALPPYPFQNNVTGMFGAPPPYPCQNNGTGTFGAPPNPFRNNGSGLFSSTAEVVKTNGPAELVSISSMPAYTKKSHELLRWEDYELGDKGGPITKLQKEIAGLEQHLGMGSRVAAYTSTPEVDFRSTQPVEKPLPVSRDHLAQFCLGGPTSTNKVDGQRRVRPTVKHFANSRWRQHSNEESGRSFPPHSIDKENSSGDFTFKFSNEPNGSHSATSTQNGALNISEAGQVAIPHQERNMESIPPKLRRFDYYTEPRIEDLDLTKPISNFLVGRRGYGSIKFLGVIHLKNVDLDSSIQFNEGEVIGLTDVTKKTPTGEVLNTLAEVTLLNIKCIDKKTGTQYLSGPHVDKYREMLIKKASEQGAEFLSYDPVNGEWKFRVQYQL